MICTLSCVLLLFWHNAEMLLTSRIMLSTIDSSLLVGVQPPWQYGFNEIHRPLRWPQTGTWHSGVQWNMHTDGVWCPTAQITSMFRGGPSWESFQSPLRPPVACGHEYH